MYLSELLKKTEKELNAIKKADIVKCLKEEKWQYDVLVHQVAGFKADKVKTDEAKLMLCSLLDIELKPIAEYDSNPNLEEVNLCAVLGMLLRKLPELVASDNSAISTFGDS